MAFTVFSPAFADGERVPVEFTCDGHDMPPPLTVRDAPQGTRSFALIMDDPDAPGGLFTHWLAYDIPPDDGGQLNAAAGKALKNSFGRSGYGGPCPPRGGGSHRYYFTVYAIDVRALELKGNSRSALEAALTNHTLGKAQLMGRFERHR